LLRENADLIHARIPRDADQQVQEDGFFREMRTSKSGKMASSPRCGSAIPGSAHIQKNLDANPEKSGFCRNPARRQTPSLCL